jgi:gliding motility-associated lipoprotein GldD
MRTTIFVLAIILFAASCEDPVFSPKPRGFPKVDFPEHSYEDFGKDFCAFDFKMPVYANIEQDTLFFEEKPSDPCWFNIYYPQFDSRLHCSYSKVESKKRLDELKADAFDLAGKHNIKANYIDELPIEKPDGTTGIVFNMEGPVASPFQFYLTDGKKHFLRGALYFNTQARPDSLAPVTEFIKTDVMQMINTLEWEK